MVIFQRGVPKYTTPDRRCPIVSGTHIKPEPEPPSLIKRSAENHA